MDWNSFRVKTAGGYNGRSSNRKEETAVKRLKVFLPGILIAATGVGAGDLLTASLGGSAVGTALLWTAVAGGILKWVLNEGVTRWQMATETLLLEGWVNRLGAWIQWVFIVYLLAWTFFTGGALITACGVAGTSLMPLSSDPSFSKIIWGILHALAGYFMVRLGGFQLFEKVMSVCIGVMFVTVLLTAGMLLPEPSELVKGFMPSIPPDGLGWVLGVLGGVGGTVTLLVYGYWIREKNRTGYAGLKISRVDLALGYTMTALFGMAMIIIGSRVEIAGKGNQVALELAGELLNLMGPASKWLFLIGFWGAVFSSLLGVWQSIPYLFTDFFLLWKHKTTDRNSIQYTETKPYRWYLLAMTLLPLPVLWISVKKAQLIYAVFGSMFMPLLALTLLIMNNRADWVGKQYKNHVFINFVLGFILLFFLFLGIRKLISF